METRPSIIDLAEKLWNGNGDLAHEHHPVHSRFPWGEEVAENVLVYKSTASANVIDTGAGLVMLDTGGQFDVDTLYEEVRKWRPSNPLLAAVFSHHHVDHVFGTARFELEARDLGWPRPVVIGHKSLPMNFQRYLKMPGWNISINERQFEPGGLEFAMPKKFREPDTTYSDGITLNYGSLTFQLHHARGETDDATWTWIPELRILHPGDLFIWAIPNAGNPQKVQRYVGDWATALRKMASLRPKLLLPGHGLPIIGEDRIHLALTETAELLESLESQTVALMELGATLNDVCHEVNVPQHLLARPYLQAIYDHPQFLVRNIWRQYGGWYDGEPDNLLPAPRVEQAKEWITLAGGLNKVIARAKTLQLEGNLRMACHLIEFAVLAFPDSKDVHQSRSEIYNKRSLAETSSMARNILGHAARSSEAGIRDLACKIPGTNHN